MELCHLSNALSVYDMFIIVVLFDQHQSTLFASIQTLFLSCFSYCLGSTCYWQLLLKTYIKSMDRLHSTCHKLHNSDERTKIVQFALNVAVAFPIFAHILFITLRICLFALNHL